MPPSSYSPADQPDSVSPGPTTSDDEAESAEESRQIGAAAPRSRKIPGLRTRAAVVSGVADGNTTVDRATAASQTPSAAQPTRTVRLASTNQAVSVEQSTRHKQHVPTDDDTSTSAHASLHQAALTGQPAFVQQPASIGPTGRGGKILRGNTDQRASQGDIGGEAATNGINSGRAGHDDQASTSMMERGQNSTSQTTTASRTVQANPAPPPKPGMKEASKGDSTTAPTLKAGEDHPAEAVGGGSGRVTAGPSNAPIPPTSTPKGPKAARDDDTSQSKPWTPLDGYDMCKVHTEKRLYLAVSSCGHAMSEGRWCLGDGNIIQWTPPVLRE